MKCFSHPNVLGLLGVVFETPDGTPYLVLPFMENGNLKNYLKSKRVNDTNVDTLPQVSSCQLVYCIRVLYDIHLLIGLTAL